MAEIEGEGGGAATAFGVDASCVSRAVCDRGSGAVASHALPPPAASDWSSVHRQSTPRSPGKGPVGVRFVERGCTRQASASPLALTTAHGASPTVTESAALSEPKPTPRTVTSVPPAVEPSAGSTELIRGTTSVSKRVPRSTSICRAAGDLYASPRPRTAKVTLKRPPCRNASDSITHPMAVLLPCARAMPLSTS
eukprot:5835701-Prymnesium_polylepis.2